VNAPAKKTTNQAIADVLRREGRPLTTREIIERVLQTERLEITSKTPAASISARLYTDAKKPNGMVERAGRGRFQLRHQ
jgi:hypothetical protein